MEPEANAHSRETVEILTKLNDTDADFPADETVHGLFSRQAARTPGRVAVVFKDLLLTYRHLEVRTDRLARQLLKEGVESGRIVGLMVERSAEMIIGILAVLKAGAAYLPVDPHSPPERVRFMLRDSGAGILLTSVHREYIVECSRSMPSPPRVVTIAGENVLQESPASNTKNSAAVPEPALPSVPATFLAYAIYTSGSTGRPKGVLIEHRSVVNRLNWMQKTYPLSPGDTLLQKTPFFFDVSVWELCWWWLAGARLCFLPPAMERFPPAIIEAVERYRVTVIHFVPSMLSAFLGYIENGSDLERLGSLRRVFCSGEALKPSQVDSFNRTLYSCHAVRLTNLYGPTEATVDVSYFDCPVDTDTRTVPLGRPIDNIKLYILDERRRLLGANETGELCISGVGLARGYLNRPQLTADNFFEPPWADAGFSINIERRAASLILYRTGDLARIRPDGNILFHGRLDHQVKIRGLRIELEEIESLLTAHDAVQDAVVIVTGAADSLMKLSAYLVADHPPADIAMKRYLKRWLPDYMIPAEFIWLAALPLGPSGKVDRRALESGAY